MEDAARSATANDDLILEAALARLAGEAEDKTFKQAELDRLAATVAGGVPDSWGLIRSILPKLQKRAQSAIVQALLSRIPTIDAPEVFVALARQCHVIDHPTRAALIARLSRMNENEEAGRQMIMMMQAYDKEPGLRAGQLTRVAPADCVELRRLLVHRASELMLFPKGLLRLSLDWTVRLQADSAGRRCLLSSMPKLLAKLKWREVAESTLEQYFTTIAALGGSAAALFGTLEWNLLFKFVLKQLRHRPGSNAGMQALGRLIAAGAAQSHADQEAQAAKAATPRVTTYDPQSGTGWTSGGNYTASALATIASNMEAPEPGEESDEETAGDEVAETSVAMKAATEEADATAAPEPEAPAEPAGPTAEELTAELERLREVLETERQARRLEQDRLEALEIEAKELNRRLGVETEEKRRMSRINEDLREKFKATSAEIERLRRALAEAQGQPQVA